MVLSVNFDSEGYVYDILDRHTTHAGTWREYHRAQYSHRLWLNFEVAATADLGNFSAVSRQTNGTNEWND
jgi:hypothetical protein